MLILGCDVGSETHYVNIITDLDGRLYLYDPVRTKKETSKPHEQ